jgi:hypothetical protein
LGDDFGYSRNLLSLAERTDGENPGYRLSIAANKLTTLCTTMPSGRINDREILLA